MDRESGQTNLEQWKRMFGELAEFASSMDEIAQIRFGQLGKNSRSNLRSVGTSQGIPARHSDPSYSAKLNDAGYQEACVAIHVV